MKMLENAKIRLSLFLVTGFSVLLTGVLLMSCGAGPQVKTEIDNAGAYAVDFSPVLRDANQDGNVEYRKKYYAVLSNSIPSLASREFTIEVQVKKLRMLDPSDPLGVAVISLTGNIFSRYGHADDTGAFINFAADIPTFTITNDTDDATSTANGSTNSGTAVLYNAWNHIAGVFVYEDHTSVHGTTAVCTAAVRAQRPHIDIYINGSFSNCGTVGSVFTDHFAYGEQIGDFRSKFTAGNPFNIPAVIDEVRFWKVARTASQIRECYDNELGVSGSSCIITSDLIGYWRLNEGTGSSVHDFSGGGNAGTKYYCVTQDTNDDGDVTDVGSIADCEATAAPVTNTWDAGWVTGYQF